MIYAEFARAMARRWLLRGVGKGGFAVLRRPASTHLLGRRVAQEYSQGSAKPLIADLLAWQQSAGMGREGRSWASPPGGVYATMIRPLAADVAMQTLPLLVATALCETLNIDLDGRCRLKWPNDLLVAGRKLGGIMIDAASRGDHGGLAVISFGVNHGHISESGTTSLEYEAPGKTLLVDLTAGLVDGVDDALGRGEAEAEVVSRYRRLSLHRPGDTLRCRLRGEQFEGIFQGFDPHGFICLMVDGEERLLTAGEVADDG